MIAKTKINIKNGYLELTPIWGGRVQLGEVCNTSLTRKDIISCLYKSGIYKGILDGCVDMLETGFEGQLPIAVAKIEIEAGSYNYFFNESPDHETLMALLNTGRPPETNMFQPVEAGQKLLEVLEMPATVLRYPDGEKKIIKEYSLEDTCFFKGLNTVFDKQNRTLVAGIDGYVYRDAFGVVMVYPTEKLFSLGKAHGQLAPQKAIEIEADIRSESDLVTPSNLVVNGIIRSSTIVASGNISCANGLDNSTKKERGTLRVGRSLLTSNVRSYKVWAGNYVLVHNAIESSIVRCGNTIAVRNIIGSELRVSNKLYVNNVKNQSHIFIGPKFVKDSDYNKRKNHHSQHEKRLIDLDNQMKIKKQQLELEKNNTIKHLKKHRPVGEKLKTSDFVFSRLVNNQVDTFQEFLKILAEYDQGLKQILDERMNFAFYETKREQCRKPEIIVNGTMSAGTIITAPNQVLRTEQDYSRVSIKLDLGTGTLSISDLNDKDPLSQPLSVNQQNGTLV